MKKVLITGAYGFVGNNLSEYLAQNTQNELIALDILIKKNSFYNNKYTWQEIDEIDFNNIDSIIHLAGIAHDTKNTKKISDYFDINVGLTKKVFDKYLNSNAKQFIYFSSVKAVADSLNNKILTEDESPDPKTPYGKSKLEAEKYLLNFKLPADKLLYILRPAMIHGPGNKGNLNMLYNLIKSGIPYPLGAYSSKRSFTSIENLNFVISHIINRKLKSGIYQIADNEALSMDEIIKLIGESTLKRPKIWNIPKPIIGIIAKVGNILYLPLNSEKLKKLTENYLVSNKKLIDELGVDLPVEAHEGLRNTLNQFK